MILLNEIENTKRASKSLRTSNLEKRNSVLKTLAIKLKATEATLISENEKDLKNLPNDTSSAFRDRLRLTPSRIEGMIQSILKIADFSDPLGLLPEIHTLPNGLKTQKSRTPLGVIFMIFESRPNVAIDAFALALKSGNALILRGGKESRQSVAHLYTLMQEALLENQLPKECFTGITDPDRSIVTELLKHPELIDVVIPRGGESLIHFVVEHSRIPIIKNDRGLCHIYVHEDADLEMALSIIMNAKTQRPGVCNSMETLLLHEKIAPTLLHALSPLLEMHNPPVKLHGDQATLKLLPTSESIAIANEASFGTEYLDYEMNCKIVKDLNEAISHIETFGSKHSEAIISHSKEFARIFQNEVDAAVVYWNASTRFTDGGELGLGGEIGISTQKLHVRGPVGLEALTCVRWIIEGTGQVRP